MGKSTLIAGASRGSFGSGGIERTRGTLVWALLIGLLAVAPGAAFGHDADIIWPACYPQDLRADADAGPEAGGRATPEVLLARFIDLHSALRYEEAARIARQLVARVPDRPIALYNLACAEARCRRQDVALDMLEQAISCGWRRLAHTRLDPDLDALRTDARYAPRYRSLIERMVALAIREQVPVSDGPRNEAWEVVRDDLRATVPALLQRYHVPGMAVALVREGRLVWSEGFGARSPTSERPFLTSDVVRLEAPGHLFSLIAVAQLERGDRLDLGQLLVQSEQVVRRPAYRSRIHLVRRGVDRRVGGGWSDAGGTLAAWPVRDAFGEADDLLRCSVQLVTRRSYADYCEDRIAGAIGLSATRVARVATPEALSPGHTELGTPLDSTRGGRSDSWIDTSCNDLAALVVACLRPTPDIPNADPGLREQVVDRVTDAASFELGRLGLGVHYAETPVGPRIQVADDFAGRGCLLRWYPDRGSGVVIVFNAANGPEAALRVAARALGGEAPASTP